MVSHVIECGESCDRSCDMSCDILSLCSVIKSNAVGPHCLGHFIWPTPQPWKKLAYKSPEPCEYMDTTENCEVQGLLNV